MSRYHLGDEECFVCGFFWFCFRRRNLIRYQEWEILANSAGFLLKPSDTKTDISSKNMEVQRLRPSWKEGSEEPNYSLLKESLS